MSRIIDEYGGVLVLMVMAGGLLWGFNYFMEEIMKLMLLYWN